jgi:methionine sulfoxide reductase heme-binding subunit
MTGFAPGSWLRARRDLLLQAAVHVGALLPLAFLIWDGLHDDLTFNPIQAITLRTGRTALALLILSLACTPAARLGFGKARKWRRPLGLYAFLYVSLHFLTFAVLDYRLDLALLRPAVLEKRYVLAGVAAGLLLAPLAVTSTRGWMWRLGRNWKRLHWLVFPAAALAVAHYAWAVKADTRIPLACGALLTILLLARTRRGKRGLAALRRRYEALRFQNGEVSPSSANAASVSSSVFRRQDGSRRSGP